MPMEPRLFVKVPRSHSTFCFEVLNTNHNPCTDKLVPGHDFIQPLCKYLGKTSGGTLAYLYMYILYINMPMEPRLLKSGFHGATPPFVSRYLTQTTTHALTRTDARTN